MIGNKQNILSPALSKQAVIMDDLATKDVIQGIKQASLLERETIKRQKEQEEARKNKVEEKPIIPTGQEIRSDFEAGEYR